VLQDGQSIAVLFFVNPSSSPLHFMFGQMYLWICFLIVGLSHFGQVCSEISSPCSISFCLPDSWTICWFIGFFIL